jgi:ankyrin repeat protein
VDGYTPLHLAVKSSEQIKTGRPMRALLMRGAPKNILDKKGKLPIDLVNEIKSESLKQELLAAL